MKCLGYVFAGLVLGSVLSFGGQRPEGVPENFNLVYSQDFESKDCLKDFQFTDPKVWTLGKEDDGRPFIEHTKGVKYKYKVRSPYNIALEMKVLVKDFVYEVELQQTGKEYGHRDMCVFYGFKDRSHFYYTHIASVTDNHAHNIFIVNDKPRTRISTKTSKGHKWGKDWHKVRVVRDSGTGRIAIFVNDMTEPLMEAEDKTFDWGYVGFGSFDDTGRISTMRIWAPESKPGDPKREIFKED